jgi:hypothetical protein
MTPRLLLPLLIPMLLVTAVDADPAAQKEGWERKLIGNVRIEVPTDCKTDVQDAPGAGAVQGMKKFSFRTRVLDLELVFLSFPSGTGGNLDGAAASMSAQLRAVSGEESLTPWKSTTVSGRPARYITTKPDRTHQARQVTLIGDTKAKDQLIIVDISYDSTSSSGKGDTERIMKSVQIE